MPKRVGYLYDKMVDRDFIRAVILEAAKGRQSRKDIARILADLDGYVENGCAKSTMRAARSSAKSRWSRFGRTA